MADCLAYAAYECAGMLQPFHLQRRELLAKDVQIEILYCGVCHSDLHMIRSDWGRTAYPCVPGHEIVGRVTAVGAQVSKFKVGDIAAVGVIVDSCRKCACCVEGEEQYCEKAPVKTYGHVDKISGGITYGGYSERIVVDEAFTLTVPEGMPLAAVAPLLCAGITTYSPLKHWGVGPGQTVAIIGLGGLGHIAVKLARALGAYVVVFTTSERKQQDALALGAHEAVVSTQAEAFRKNRNRFDFILDTVSAPHDINAYLSLLKRDATLCQVGLPAEALSLNVFALTGQRRSIAGSFIGGIAQTQEMLNFCAEHGVLSDIELINIQDVNKAYERLERGDVRYRFVIDMASLKS